jgi:cytidine deaminase
MNNINISIEIKQLEANELTNAEQELVNESVKASQLAYAPYSNFKVGASLRLSNGTIISGSNQENASFPVGICAERVALANHAMQYPNTTIESIAIYVNNKPSQPPAAPCGMCRQALYEQEAKQKTPIRLLLKGNGNEIVAVNSVKDLLPLGFSGSDL